MAGDPKTGNIGILIQDRDLMKSLVKERKRVSHWNQCALRLFESWESYRNAPTSSIYIILRGRTDVGKSYLTRSILEHAKFMLLMNDVPAQSVTEIIDRLPVRSHLKLHVADPAPEREADYVSRFINTLCAEDADETIMDAWWEGDLFVVKSPAFKSLKVPLSSLPVNLQKASPEHRTKFEIDQYGEFVYWPALDIHMGWPQFEQAANPAARLRAEQKSRKFNERYGKAIRQLREQHGLTQMSIPGLDSRTVRRIEQGETRATANALQKLADAHGLTLSTYMNELSKQLA